MSSTSPSRSPSPSTMVNGGSGSNSVGSGSASSGGAVAPSLSKPKTKAPKPAALKKSGYKTLETSPKYTNSGWFMLQVVIPLTFLMFFLHITGVQEFKDNYWVKWYKGELDEDGNPLPDYVPAENGFHMLYPENVVPSDVSKSKKKDQGTSSSEGPNLSPYCERRFRSMMGLLGRVETFKQANIEIHLHRNGDPHACGKTTGGMFLDELMNQYANFDDGCRSYLNKYEVESLLTATLHLLTESSCASDDDKQGDDEEMKGFLGFCDRGTSKTPILPDHDDLVPVSVEYNKDENVQDNGSSNRHRDRDRTQTLPCRFHSREGLRISIFKQITDMALFENEDTDNDDGDDAEILGPVDSPQATTTEETSTKTNIGRAIHLYAVPAGRVFMFAPSYVGEIFNLTHVNGVHNESIYLEVLSLDPRVFDIHNFFSRQESQDLVDKAIAEKSPSHKIKRSTTGAGSSSVNSRRTSESGFDTHGKTASLVKRRCFNALGFDEYWDTFGDGLQILRYNVTTAYNSHLDYIEDKSGQLEHDFDSSGTGGNRFATILMYMSDLEPGDGGETVFPRAWPPGLPEEERVPMKTALAQLRESDRGDVLERGSWEEQLVAKCRTKFSVRPHSSRAILFYSQFPDGKVDPMSLHAACPLLDKQKYAANLWVWNTPRQGYPGSPIKEKFRKDPSKDSNRPNTQCPSPPPKLKEKKFVQINVIFTNTGKDPRLDNAELFYQNKFWTKIWKGSEPVSVNTYEGHVWNVRTAEGQVIQSFEISAEGGTKQFYEI